MNRHQLPSLDDTQFDTLLLMLGYAAGTAFSNGDKKMGFAFVRLANKLNEGNPNYIPYEIPDLAATEPKCGRA